MAEQQELFTAPEAAAFLRYEPTTLAVWRSHAKGPAYVKFGRTIRYRRRDLVEWVDGGPAVQSRIEQTAECHVAKRNETKRLRGRAAVEQRARRLAAEPYCRDCRLKGEERLADEVDHIVPLDAGGSDEDDNVRSLCRPCHAARTRGRLTKKR
jgi:5-methylcytosine-specific restriction protein A